MVGMFTAFRINYLLYLVIRYGWENVWKFNLHMKSYHPVVVSNGDVLSDVANLGVFVGSLVLGFVIAVTLLSSIQLAVRLLGQAVEIVGTMDVLAKRIGRKQDEDRGDIVFHLLAITIACTVSFVTVHGSFLHTVRNGAIFVAVASLMLRVTLTNVASAESCLDTRNEKEN